MKTLKTITGRTITVVSSNKKMRTYTLKTDAAVYRTITLDKDEFKSAEKWTGNDWNNFLMNTSDYYKVSTRSH